MKSILLVEDDRWLAESYAQQLGAAGYAVKTTMSADEAMREIEKALPDLLIVDLLLGAQNSLMLLHELQSHDDTKHIPVIVCSGVTHEALKPEHVKRYGVVTILDKSTLTPEQMLSAVSDQLDLKS